MTSLASSAESRAKRPVVEASAVALILIGLAGGTMGGLSGIGGGAIMIPLIVTVVGLTQHQAHGTSLAIIVPGALASAVPYFLFPREGLVPPFWAVVLLTVPAMLGAPLGAKLVNFVDGSRLKRLFGVLLISLAVRFLAPDPIGSISLWLGIATIVVGMAYSIRNRQRV